MWGGLCALDTILERPREEMAVFITGSGVLSKCVWVNEVPHKCEHTFYVCGISYARLCGCHWVYPQRRYTSQRH